MIPIGRKDMLNYVTTLLDNHRCKMNLKDYEYYRTDLGVLYCGDCLEIMPHLAPVDLVVTSPPYDDLRKYEVYEFDFYKTAILLRNKLITGGIIVWVVADQTVNGSETGTSARQALFFKAIKLNLHDTMFYQKDPMPLTHNRYEQAVEYMFVFSNGKPKTFNPILEHCIHAGKNITGNRRHNLHDLEPCHGFGKTTRGKKYKNNIWYYSAGFNKSTLDKIAYEHPAIFPEGLARDHILSWSNENDIVMDPMCGSGTTCKIAEKLNRRWIGIETSENYCRIARKRIEKERSQLKLFT